MKSNLLRVFCLILLIFVTGCGKTSLNEPYTSAVPSPLKHTCSNNSDCMLTTQIYHPCGTVAAVATSATDAEIDELNKSLYKYYEGRKYDCPVPSDISEFSAECQDSQCVAVFSALTVSK